MTRDTILSFKIPSSLKDAIQRRAEAERRSVSSYIMLLLEKHVEETPEPEIKSASKSRK
jgi:hypothetical protein